MDERAQRSETDQAPQTTDRLLRYLPLMALGNMAVAVPTFVISLTLAYFTFVQAEATQKMQVAAVWPYVSFGSSNYDTNGEPRIALALGNDGAGPARIAGLQLTYNGKAEPNLRALLAACCAQDPARLGYGEQRINGEVLRPGETVAFATLSPLQSGPEVWSAFERERFRVKTEVCYCSVFDECWVRDMSQSQAERVDECPADWTQFSLAPRNPQATLEVETD
ncbi:MAG: hypothetical protein AAFQ13_07675 [Pseudomonadota bacterium]